MSPFRLRDLAEIMNGTQRQIDTLLALSDAEPGAFPFISYNDAYCILRRNAGDPERATAQLVDWRDRAGIEERTRSFRQNNFVKIAWCANEVLPKIVRVVESLDGDRQKTGQLLELAGESYTGGFHALVEWNEGGEASVRLVYFLGPPWSKRKVRNLFVLLQLKAIQVYSRAPQSVVVVDMSNRKIIERLDIDPDDRDLAYRTAQWLHDWKRLRKAA